MPEATLRISFPESATADAGVLARELKSDLAEAGVPPNRMQVAREDPEGMDIGSIMFIAAEALFAQTVTEMARMLFNFVKRNRTELTIHTPAGEWRIRSRDGDPEKIAEILSKIAEHYRAQS